MCFSDSASVPKSNSLVYQLGVGKPTLREAASFLVVRQWNSTGRNVFLIQLNAIEKLESIQMSMSWAMVSAS